MEKHLLVLSSRINRNMEKCLDGFAQVPGILSGQRWRDLLLSEWRKEAKRGKPGHSAVGHGKSSENKRFSGDSLVKKLKQRFCSLDECSFQIRRMEESLVTRHHVADLFPGVDDVTAQASSSNARHTLHPMPNGHFAFFRTYLLRTTK